MTSRTLGRNHMTKYNTIGASIVRQGLEVYYSKLTIRNSQNSIGNYVGPYIVWPVVDLLSIPDSDSALEIEGPELRSAAGDTDDPVEI